MASLEQLGKTIENSNTRIALVKEDIRKVKTLPKSTLRKNKLHELNKIRQLWEETHRGLLKELEVARLEA